MSNRFYITTPIYYPNAEPHLGHVYTTICADVLARYHRLSGEDTFFLTGTDEHGIKMVKEAEKQGVDPHTLTERNVRIFKQVWQELKISNDDFIRTTEPRHESAVQKIVQKLLDNGDIYLGTYEGWYDEGQEEFVTETEAKANEYKSAVSGRPLVRYKEPTYFFRLSKYVPGVIQHIETNPQFVQPASRRNEVLSKLRAGVGDLSISRSTLKWGVPMPNDPGHVVYVWIDALSNYITALGYGSHDDARYRRYWPADVHLIGKEILWFHAVYWPAMLLSLGEPLPRRIFAHGWWTAEGRKMSKSMGNFIDLDRLRGHVRTYGRDALRYYLLRAAPFGNDLDWKEVDFQAAFNELANVVGNCLNRTVRMIHRYRGGVLPPATQHEPADDAVIAATHNLAEQIAAAYDRIELQQCALLPVELARTTNTYIDATAPFALAKDPSKSARLDTVLNRSAQAICRALAALLPILPEKAAQGLSQLGVDVTGKTLGELLNSELGPGQVVGQGTPLFPRINAGD
ncbi:MAG TPA: methionine--tRNA ligase [Tepidisphaeraceae bacterium]|nr:methionine--tRNA ligase [Tepidisphaeraceae bacterium]